MNDCNFMDGTELCQAENLHAREQSACRAVSALAESDLRPLFVARMCFARNVCIDSRGA